MSDAQSLISTSTSTSTSTSSASGGRSYKNTIGDGLLFAHWTDPDFDASQYAFYYVRVVEIPTPRWTAFDAKIFGIDMPDDVPMKLQERAYTSPIWYTPGGTGKKGKRR